MILVRSQITKNHFWVSINIQLISDCNGKYVKKIPPERILEWNLLQFYVQSRVKLIINVDFLKKAVFADVPY